MRILNVENRHPIELSRDGFELSEYMCKSVLCKYIINALKSSNGLSKQLRLSGGESNPASIFFAD